MSGDLQVRPFVRYGETGNLGSTGYEKCVGPDAKPVDGYHKTDAEAVRADLVFDPTTFREERASDAAVGDFGVSEEDVANVCSAWNRSPSSSRTSRSAPLLTRAPATTTAGWSFRTTASRA